MEIETLPLERLIPYARNSRTHSADQVAQIVASIQEFGFTNPVLIDEDDGIIAGHWRVLAATKAGLSEVPCIRLSHLTPVQRRAYVIADNRIALNAGWDTPMLALELVSLEADGFDLDLLGFSADELKGFLADMDEGLTDPDDAPDVPTDPVSRPGDVWVCGRHRVMCGDATNPVQVEELMGGVLADCCWTDPPYNVAYEGRAGKIKNDDMADAEFRDFLIAAYSCMFLAMKPGASIYVAHADTEGSNFRLAMKEAGFKLSGCLIWRKDSLVLGRSDYQWMHEPILYGWKPGAKHRWFGGRKQTTVADLPDRSPFTRMADGRYMVEVGDRIMVVDGGATVQEMTSSVIHEPKPKRSDAHPTMKPIALIDRMLKNSSRPGDVVLDLFGGSGSTLIAGARLGLSARVMELDPRFADVIVSRWQEFSGDQAVLESDGSKFPNLENGNEKKARA